MNAAFSGRLFLAGLLVLAGAGPTSSGEMTSGALVSGLPRGAKVPEFYSRVVTGPLMNKTVCYVCRNGGRPVVMVFVRTLNPRVRQLLRNVDRIVDEHRADGLRSFAVLLSESPGRWDVSRVQTFAFNGRIELPLTVAADEISSPQQQNLHEDAAVTVVLYHRRKVVDRMALREDDLDVERLRPLVKRVLAFAEDVSGL